MVTIYNSEKMKCEDGNYWKTIVVANENGDFINFAYENCFNKESWRPLVVSRILNHYEKYGYTCDNKERSMFINNKINTLILSPPKNVKTRKKFIPPLPPQPGS
jgi:hypothetical protein